MTFSQSISTCFAKYMTFTGRASRSEFWWWALFVTIVDFLASAVTGFDGSVLPSIVSIVLFLPGLGVSCRRMHDIGKGAGWIFINLVPLIGWIWYIVLAATPGEPGDNRFGPAPQS